MPGGGSGGASAGRAPAPSPGGPPARKGRDSNSSLEWDLPPLREEEIFNCTRNERAILDSFLDFGYAHQTPDDARDVQNQKDFESLGEELDDFDPETVEREGVIWETVDSDHRPSEGQKIKALFRPDLSHGARTLLDLQCEKMMSGPLGDLYLTADAHKTLCAAGGHEEDVEVLREALAGDRAEILIV